MVGSATLTRKIAQGPVQSCRRWADQDGICTYSTGRAEDTVECCRYIMSYRTVVVDKQWHRTTVTVGV